MPEHWIKGLPWGISAFSKILQLRSLLLKRLSISHVETNNSVKFMSRQLTRNSITSDSASVNIFANCLIENCCHSESSKRWRITSCDWSWTNHGAPSSTKVWYILFSKCMSWHVQALRCQRGIKSQIFLLLSIPRYFVHIIFIVKLSHFFNENQMVMMGISLQILFEAT